MGRSIGGAIVGYIVMFVVIFVSFTCAYLVMGPDRAYTPGTYEVSGLWLVVSFALGTVAAVLGGVVCAAIARGDRRGILFLVILVLVLGAAGAVAEMTKDRSVALAPRTGEVGNLEAMMKTVQPLWVVFLNPLIGAAGAVIGGRLVRRRGPA